MGSKPINKIKKKFIPAAKFKLLTPLFDTFLSIGGLGKNYRRWVISTISDSISPNFSLLDAGCGTGSIAIEANKLFPSIKLIAIDIDKEILKIAQKKSNNIKRRNDKNNSKKEITWECSSLTKLPFKDSNFDLIYSSLVTHHLNKKQKKLAFSELCRVLKKNQTLFICDFGKIKNPWISPYGLFISKFEEGKENIEGKLPNMLISAGFSSVEIISKYKFGIVCYKAVK